MNLNHHVFYTVLMLVAGFGIPIMAALNGGLGEKLQSTVLATTILFVVGAVVSILCLLFFEGMPELNADNSVPIYFYCGGLLVVFYVLSITWVIPRFGVGNAVACVLLGQLFAMAIIDHYGLLGTAHYPMSLQRFIGLILMAVGVFLAVRRF